ncbi:hypothetical protein C2G38_2046931 [Gigaspora rosea]|uniref:Uncharacterized protein n=1 Tax=Gigaspora rosea TaxID=44941 RepID=A0A397U973_9GLOM|nr:hypothetical protein C2G38_2046931 [Gigaspora rosea]
MESANLADYRLYSTSETLEEVIHEDTNKATDKATNEITDETIDNDASLQGLQESNLSNLEETLFTTEQSKSEQDSISYNLVFDTDSSDDESGDETFSTWEAIGNFLNKYGQEKALVFEEDILSQK